MNQDSGERFRAAEPSCKKIGGGGGGDGLVNVDCYCFVFVSLFCSVLFLVCYCLSLLQFYVVCYIVYVTLLKMLQAHWPSSHYAVTHVRNKNSNIHGRSPIVVKVIFHTIRNCS